MRGSRLYVLKGLPADGYSPIFQNADLLKRGANENAHRRLIVDDNCFSLAVLGIDSTLSLHCVPGRDAISPVQYSPTAIAFEQLDFKCCARHSINDAGICSSCPMVAAPTARIASSPAAPSRPIPVSNTPMPRFRAVPAIDFEEHVTRGSMTIDQFSRRRACIEELSSPSFQIRRDLRARHKHARGSAHLHRALRLRWVRQSLERRSANVEEKWAGICWVMTVGGQLVGKLDNTLINASTPPVEEPIATILSPGSNGISAEDPGGRTGVDRGRTRACAAAFTFSINSAAPP